MKKYILVYQFYDNKDKSATRKQLPPSEMGEVVKVLTVLDKRHSAGEINITLVQLTAEHQPTGEVPTANKVPVPSKKK